MPRRQAAGEYMYTQVVFQVGQVRMDIQIYVTLSSYLGLLDFSACNMYDIILYLDVVVCEIEGTKVGPGGGILNKKKTYNINK